ncbi:actin cytoskeleton-regulatory complex protein pan1-like [Haliotis rubra]|uniref:actin cytoskeleton-regulatory complex protein pan1-like n=1 Tax=Haliotis rubra TaxID=36100 RepID=UPI001EE56FE7|nr:actin cytoskeleton-regulatory complex protein pan1-like [Haliotis rubra]
MEAAKSSFNTAVLPLLPKEKMNDTYQFAERHYLSVNFFNGVVYVHLTNWNSRGAKKSISMTADIFKLLMSSGSDYTEKVKDFELLHLPVDVPEPEIAVPAELMLPPPPPPPVPAGHGNPIVSSPPQTVLLTAALGNPIGQAVSLPSGQVRPVSPTPMTQPPPYPGTSRPTPYSRGNK